MRRDNIGYIQVDAELGLVLKSLSPLIMYFEPKEDITTFELAEAMIILISMGVRHIMPYEIDMTKPYIRHFRITDPNDIEKNMTTRNIDFTGENLISISVNI